MAKQQEGTILQGPRSPLNPRLGSKATSLENAKVVPVKVKTEADLDKEKKKKATKKAEKK
jgi:hypothetical protein